MAEVKWTPQALKDIEKIADYYALEFPKYAETLTEDIFRQTQKLEKFPKAGRLVPEIGDEKIREIIYQNYRIIYWLDDENVEIMTVFHTSRQFGELPKSSDE